MSELDAYISDRARSALDGIAEEEREHIYVVSFFVYDEDDDPRRPTLTVGFNTESDVAHALGHTDEDDARWNYAYFRHNALTVMFESQRDPEGANIRDAAIEAVGYTFPDEDDLATTITTPWFVANAGFAARRLHDDGDIVRIFGRSIPVLVHELEYYDLIAMQNLAANPPGVVEEFVEWCRFAA